MNLHNARQGAGRVAMGSVGGIMEDYRNYLSGDSDSDGDLDAQTLDKLKSINAKYSHLITSEAEEGTRVQDRV